MIELTLIVSTQQEFNARTAHLEPGIPTPVHVTIQADRTFTFAIRTPPTSLLLKRAAGITSGAGMPGSETAGTVSLKHIYEIAKIKKADAPLLGEEQVSEEGEFTTRRGFQAHVF